ncbi:MAG: hypothetical protein RL528_1489, partial [Bacteroidota bacterium]
MNKIFLKTILFIAATSILASCDKDFNNVGAEIIGDDHYGMEKYTGSLSINASQLSTGPIQTNNLEINPLGIYDNPVFGKTTASFVTQVQLASVAPTYTTGLTRVIQSVKLYIPYFSTNKGVKTNGAYTYALDSIVNPSDKLSKIKLSVFENNRFMGAADTSNSLLTPYLFFTNNTDSNNNSITAPIGSRLNNATTVTENDNFVFDEDEVPVITTIAGVSTTTYKAPGVNLNLDKVYFDNKILHL